EENEFNANGLPVLDLTDDVHEFVELRNAGETAIDLTGWRIDSGIEFVFPTNAVIPAQGYIVIASDPPRLSIVPRYHIPATNLYGPYQGHLGNAGNETVRLKDPNNTIIDAVSYSSSFPWPTTADGFGASERWTGIVGLDWQYLGRSLERLSPNHPGSDPANWRASAFPGTPSPGRENSVAQIGRAHV